MRSSWPKTARNYVKRWRMTGLVLFAYAIIVGLMTWPALRDLNQGLIGKDVDTWIFFWNNWWFGEALTKGLNLFETINIFFPSGTGLFAHSNSFTNSLLAFILEPFTGPAAAYNLTLLLGLWLSAVGMYLLVRDLTADPLASFLAGFVFAFAPYHITQAAAHDHLSAIHWWPFFALFLRRTLLTGRWRNAAAAGLFAALTIWSGLQLGVLAFIWSFAYITWFLWTRRTDIFQDRSFWKGTISRITLLFVITILLSAPILWNILTNWSAVTQSAASYNEGLVKNADLLAYFIPPKLNPLFVELVRPLLDQFGYSSLFSPYIGFSVLILATIAVFGWRKEAYFWLITLFLWLVLAMGSAFRFNGVLYEGVPLPFKWLGTIFPISTIRAPDRFNLLTIFSFSVLAGLGGAYLLKHRFWRWILAPLSLLIVVEFFVAPIPMWDLLQGSPILDKLASDEDIYAIIDYPLGYNNSKLWLYYQTLHGKPIVEGHVSRYTPDTYSFLIEQPLLHALYAGSERPPSLPPNFFQFEEAIPALGPALRQLETAGFKYLLVHNQYADSERLSHLQSLLPLYPIFQDNALTVYDLSQPWPDNTASLDHSLGPDVRLVQALAHYDSDNQELQIQLLTQLLDQASETPDCKLYLSGLPGAVSFNPLPVKTDWTAGDLANQTLGLKLPEDLAPGQYNWAISCPEGKPFVGRESIYVDINGPALLKPELYLNFEELIALDGYRWWFQQSDLHLALRWQALTDIESDYKVFVHLINDKGTVVRQHDAFHCNWECPSSQWNANRTVVDERSLPLFGLPAGEYKLAFGLYDGITGERLQVQESQGQDIQDAYFILPESIAIPGNP